MKGEYTDKKENLSHLQEKLDGSVAKSYMWKGFLMYVEMHKYSTTYEEAVNKSFMTFQPLPSEFPYINVEPVLDEPEGLALWKQHQDPVERTHQLLLTVQQLTQQRITAVTADTSKNNSCHSCHSKEITVVTAATSKNNS